MTRALKVTGKVLLIILGIVIALLLVIFVYHRIMLAKEESLIEEPIGQMVEVDGKKMWNLYSLNQTIKLWTKSPTISEV